MQDAKAAYRKNELPVQEKACRESGGQVEAGSCQLARNGASPAGERTGFCRAKKALSCRAGGEDHRCRETTGHYRAASAVAVGTPRRADLTCREFRPPQLSARSSQQYRPVRPYPHGRARRQPAQAVGPMDPDLHRWSFRTTLRMSKRSAGAMRGSSLPGQPSSPARDWYTAK